MNTENMRAYARIDLSAISSNIEIIRRRLGSKTKLMAIIKADAYGHGAAAVAVTAIKSGADCLGVAICEEGLEIRSLGIKEPILVLGYTPETMLEQAIAHNIAVTVYDYNTALKISEIASRNEKKAFVHIKIDTGMNRLGFMPNAENVDIIKKISNAPNICLEGIFTHFSTADEHDLSFTHEQAGRFEIFCDMLIKSGVNIPLRHAANSAAAIRSDSFLYDMVRIGILIYGLKPSAETGFCGYDFKPALSLFSQISHIKKIDAGKTVGYGRTFRSRREITVATVPLGYADGYTRALGNRAKVLVRGCKAPIIGTVCMDQFMIDITDVKGCHEIKPGELVTLIGRDGCAEITADDVAEWYSGVNYEVVCRISKRVPRIYCS